MRSNPNVQLNESIYIIHALRLLRAAVPRSSGGGGLALLEPSKAYGSCQLMTNLQALDASSVFPRSFLFKGSSASSLFGGGSGGGLRVSLARV